MYGKTPSGRRLPLHLLSRSEGRKRASGTMEAENVIDKGGRAEPRRLAEKPH
jgi:hypothetical protein